ncbi:MAG: RagB/SusD family nutrient uptake outer membrane protein [Muribaculaceae bacterium]
MKNKYKLFVYLFTLITFSSCEDFLDRPPLNMITDKEITFSATEMELYVNKYYGNFPSPWITEYGIFGLDNSSDNMIHGNYNNNGLLSGVYIEPTSDGGWDWTNVRSVNFFIENYHKTKESMNNVAPYIGEAYFWRAWFYFGLMKNYGDLPWINKTLSIESEELYGERLSRTIIADSIIADMDKAIAFLPTRSNAAQGRVHKEAALLFQARIALYEGSWEKYHNGTIFGVVNANPDRFFHKAATATDELINMKTHEIEKGGTKPEEYYWGLFNKKDYSKSKEIMMYRAHNISLGINEWTNNYFGVSDANTGISKYLVESYLCTDGKPISLSPLYQGDDLVDNELKNRDPRLTQTIYKKGDVRNSVNGVASGYFTYPDMAFESRLRNTTGYQLKKGANPEANHTSGDETGTIIFRYAEALLIHAEAKAELNECTQDVLDKTINVLRDRVSMPHLNVNVEFIDPKWEFPELSPLLNEIRRERRVELGCEGYRFDDLYRWAATRLIKRPMYGAKIQQFIDAKDQFKPVLDPNNISVNEKGYIAPYWDSPAKNGWQFDEKKNYLYALPLDQLIMNTKLKQNPGYKKP